MASAAAPQFQTVFLRAEHFGAGHVDDAAGNELAGVSADASALLLGVVGFAGQIVSFLLGPFAGVWVERLERRKLLVWTQAAGAVQSLALAALTLAHVITLWEVIALQCSTGFDQCLHMPGGNRSWCRW